ncbi:ABC transporter ATP-binding protein [Dyella soli]|uniref:ABC transporter ATP-binding protein n=1 Tax=Dyella soli TaxID=522319 RepID=A0A4R0YSG7_9GAMM|nr:ABC transporter ATP-binding protein [Dyella soli]TCI09114.1 ABC transporter ATP-binding protein [Dyella soli]
MDQTGRDDAPASPEPTPASPPPPGLLDDFGRLGRAFQKLFGAQLSLLAAELGLARSAVHWLLAAGLVATIAGVGLGLTLLGLTGWLLAQWFNSWTWALVVLALLELGVLGGAILLFRRCMHWMSLPATRGEWNAMMRDVLRRPEPRDETRPEDVP